MSFQIYTIGYGNRTPEMLVEQLRKYNIDYLIDVRTTPYSRYRVEYNKTILNKFLEIHSFQYVFMGDTLGGHNMAALDEDGRVDYLKLQKFDTFTTGIKRIHTAISKEFLLVLMCQCPKPERCHRVKLVAKVLDEEGVSVGHIDETGRLRDHRSVVESLLSTEQELFDDKLGRDRILHKSRNTYN